MNFEQVKIYSNRLGKQVEAEAAHVGDKLIISHDWLIMFATDYKLVFEPVKIFTSSDLNSCFVCGKMYSAFDVEDDIKTVWGRGSASPSTVYMTSAVPSSYFLPEIAWNRCEDDCILRYFGFPRRCYSSEMFQPTVAMAEKSQQDAKNIFDSSDPFGGTASPFEGDPFADTSNPFADGDDYPYSTGTKATPPPMSTTLPYNGDVSAQNGAGNSSTQSQQTDYGEIKCTIGKYKGLKFGEITDEGLLWFAKTFNARDINGKEHVKAAKAVLAQRGVPV